MKRVKLIRKNLIDEDYGYYQAYLEEFIQQDITILSLTETGDSVLFDSATIVYECSEFFVDKTGADSVKISSEGLGKKARIVITPLAKNKPVEYKE